jgi:hypothetical protein
LLVTKLKIFSEQQNPYFEPEILSQGQILYLELEILSLQQNIYFELSHIMILLTQKLLGFKSVVSHVSHDAHL